MEIVKNCIAILGSLCLGIVFILGDAGDFSIFFYVGMLIIILITALSIHLVVNYHKCKLTTKEQKEKEFWEPLKDARGGSFQTYKLKMLNPDMYIYLPTLQNYLFAIFVFSWGIIIIIRYVINPNWQVSFWAGTIFVSISVFMFFNLKIIIFNKKKQKCFINSLFKYCHKKNRCVSLDNIRAIQIIDSSLGSGESSDTIVFQINLVLVNDQRIYLMSHPSLKTAQEDAKQLSIFINNIPILKKINFFVIE